jgi:hypothetical protein
VGVLTVHVQAIQKKERAERELAKVEHFMNPADAPVDREHITEEERYMFRKLGLRMKAYLLVGQDSHLLYHLKMFCPCQQAG